MNTTATASPVPAAILAYEERRALIAAATAAGPSVGMPATFNCGSDRYAEVIASVSKSGHKVVTESGRVFTRRADGAYRSQGSSRGMSLTLGVAESYYDPSF